MENYNYFAAILTVTDTESTGLYRNFPERTPLAVKGDTQAYFETVLQTDGTDKKIVFAQANEMGMTASAVFRAVSPCSRLPALRFITN